MRLLARVEQVIKSSRCQRGANWRGRGVSTPGAICFTRYLALCQTFFAVAAFLGCVALLSGIWVPGAPQMFGLMDCQPVAECECGHTQ